MKSLQWNILILGLMVLLMSLGCDDENNGDGAGADSDTNGTDDSETGNGGGTLTVTISDASAFDDHILYFTIYDSDETDSTTGGPTGTMLAIGMITVDGGIGSTVALEVNSSMIPVGDKQFDAGTYYLGGSVDMNDNMVASGYQPDSGDLYGPLVPVTVNGNTSLPLTADQFPLEIP